MRIAGVIIAGGRSSRMGREKAFELLDGKTLLDHVVERVAPQVTTMVINANGNPGRFESSGLAVFPDRRSGVGTPLAGLHTALLFAREEGFNAALTVPSDAPFVPHDLVSRLAAERCAAAIAASGGQRHFLTGLWSHTLLEDLQSAIDDDAMVRVKDWVAACGAADVEWPVIPFDPFFNVNTPEELAEARRIAAEFRP